MKTMRYSPAMPGSRVVNHFTRQSCNNGIARRDFAEFQPEIPLNMAEFRPRTIRLRYVAFRAGRRLYAPPGRRCALPSGRRGTPSPGLAAPQRSRTSLPVNPAPSGGRDEALSLGAQASRISTDAPLRDRSPDGHASPDDRRHRRGVARVATPLTQSAAPENEEGNPARGCMDPRSLIRYHSS